jgi:hypothetical protein
MPICGTALQFALSGTSTSLSLGTCKVLLVYPARKVWRVEHRKD